MMEMLRCGPGACEALDDVVEQPVADQLRLGGVLCMPMKRRTRLNEK